jgi:hypothetical protein
MEIGLTEGDVKLITIIQQVCSVLSLVGCLFIISTFFLCDAFHKPINRLVFYASFGNIMASICFIMADSFIDSPEGAGCQTQAFLLHTYVTNTQRLSCFLPPIRCTETTQDGNPLSHIVLWYTIPPSVCLYLHQKQRRGAGIW